MSKTNAKQELLRDLGNDIIKCAFINNDNYYNEIDNEGFTKYILNCNYTEDEYSKFIESLDFEYDSGYGGQELFGNVYLLNGTKLQRGEYDGSEWWEDGAVSDNEKQLDTMNMDWFIDKIKD